MRSRTTKSVIDTLDAAAGVVCITDPKGTVLFVNKTVEQKNGFSAAQAVGTRPSTLWGGNMSRGYYDQLWGTISKEKHAFAAPIWNTHKSGRMLTQQIRVFPLFTASQEINGYMALFPATGHMPKERQLQKWTQFSGQEHGKKAFKQIAGWVGTDVHIRTKGSLSALLYEHVLLPNKQRYLTRFEDAQLIEDAQKYPEQFAFLYKKYVRMIADYFYKRTGVHDVTNDLVQEVFIRAFAHIDRYQLRNASYKTYLFRIAHNVLVNYYRDAKKGQHDELSEHLADNNQSIATQLYLSQLLTSVSATDRQVLEMKYLEKLTAKEIGELLGKTENAVKLVLSRARRKIREGNRSSLR